MLSKQIVKLRKKADLTQAQLANELKISPSAEGMYEQGRRTPDLNTLVEMARFFKVSLDYLVTGEEYDQGENKKSAEDDCPCATCYWRDYKST